MMLPELQQGAVPFTYRFLGLRLRLAFTKRRFQRVEASFQNHVTTGQDTTNELQEIMEDSFTTLRDEIVRIEAGQEKMTRKALPKVEELILLHRSFLVFLHGFRPKATSEEDEEQNENENYCRLPLLNRGKETTTAIKQLIAEFAGVPRGLQIHDLTSLHLLLTTT